MQKSNEVQLPPESIRDPESVASQESGAPHLAQRMVHPALLQGANMMNLGSAARRFGSENIVISPSNQERRSSVENTPPGPSEGQRPFSLAEAMQAARRLNMDQPRQQFQQNVDSKNDTENDIAMNDDNLAVNSTDLERDFTPEPDSSILKVIPSANITEDLKESETEPVEENSDNAKNIEIRRLSSTEEGNKVLEPSFHSPEKNAKKNPLQNIFNIVSGMEIPTSSDEVGDGRMNGNSRNSSPGVLGPHSPGVGIMRAQLKGRKVRQFSPLPPLPHSPPAWVRGLRPALPVQQTQQIVVAPQQLHLTGQPVQQVQQVQQVQSQPMYQMVQTVNGTMLVPINQPIAVENQNFLQIQPAPAPAAPQQMMEQSSPASSASSGSSSKSSSPGSSSNESPTSKKKTRKRAVSSVSPCSTGPAPLLLSPGGNVLQTFQPSPVTATSGQILFNPTQQAGSIISPQVVPQQNVLVNPANQQMILANGTLMAVPQAQGIMYQQLPDGSLVQVASQIPAMGTMIAQPSQLMVNTPQLILTPQGLMQAVGPIGAVPDINRQVSPGFQAQKKRVRETKKSKSKKKMKASSSDTSMEQDASEGVVERDSVDETDTSFEEPQPSTSKELSPRSSIQSNQVDSSGLNATPPHHKEGDFEQLRCEVSPGPGSEELQSSLDTSRQSRASGPSTPASNISLLDYDSDLDLDLDEAPRLAKAVSSSSKKKKKKKKKRSHGHGSQSSSSQPEFALSDLVWGPVNGSPSWPGKIVSEDEDRSKVWVCWFVTRQVTQIDVSKLKTLSDGLEEHHRERKHSRRWNIRSPHLAVIFNLLISGAKR